MPKPNSGESESDFVSRCIPIVIDDGTADDESQAAAICYSIYEQHNKTATGHSYKDNKFKTKKELFDFLVENKSALIAEKKYSIKNCDVVSFNPILDCPDNVGKSAQTETPDQLNVKSVINTTNIMDSHDDVHIPGLWNKSLKENKSIYLIEEHKMSFRNIISSDVKAYADMMNWTDLGYNAQGLTQALIFDSIIKRNRNPYMFEQYANGYVKNHSVGMRYINIQLSINDKNYKTENDSWNKYINEIINRDQAEKRGFFWAVTEAKIVEGSAVVIGSNTITPTLSVEPKSEPHQSTQDKALDTQQIRDKINNYKFI